MEMQKIYIVLTYTGTILSKLIRFVTRKPYCHVSIALDKELKEMYSFGRLNPYNPFIGGFVHEGLHVGTFERFQNTIAEIYSIEVTNEQYNQIKDLIKEFHQHFEQYQFNVIGLFVAGLHIHYQKENHFYCAEFVKYVIDYANIKIDLPDLIKPMDFYNKEPMKLEYKGNLRNYEMQSEFVSLENLKCYDFKCE